MERRDRVPDQPLSTGRERRVARSPLHQQLKRETADLHRRLEAQFELLLKPELSIESYRRILQTFVGFYDPIEAGLARLFAAGAVHGFALQARARRIELDLSSLGMSPHELAELPRCAELPRLSSTEELSGCLYVLEGACLGGQVIAPVLHRRLGVAKGTGAAFFSGDEAGTAARWSAFLAWLERLTEAGARPEPIVASARATFLAFAQWAERHSASWSPASAREARHG